MIVISSEVHEGFGADCCGTREYELIIIQVLLIRLLLFCDINCFWLASVRIRHSIDYRQNKLYTLN